MPNREKPTQILFRERVLPSILGWSPLLLLGIGVGVAISPISGIPVAAVVGVFVVLVAMVLIWSSAPIIELSNEWLRVAQARLPLAAIASARAIPAEEAFAERGPRLDARAFVRFQATVKPLCRVELRDGDDPTPYWLFATRRPEELAQLIGVARDSQA